MRGFYLRQTLFNIFVEKFPSDPHLRVFCYANDIAPLGTSPDKLTCVRALLHTASPMTAKTSPSLPTQRR